MKCFKSLGSFFPLPNYCLRLFLPVLFLIFSGQADRCFAQSAVTCVDQTGGGFPHYSINGGQYIAQPNYWNTSCNGQMCMTINTSNGDWAVTSMSAACVSVVAAYPAIYLGNHYGVRTNGWTPVQVSALNCSLTNWTFSGPGTVGGACYNISYDLWFCPTTTCNNGWANGAELMVWVNYVGAGAIPSGFGNEVGTNVPIAGYNWNIYEANIGWNVIFLFDNHQYQFPQQL